MRKTTRHIILALLALTLAWSLPSCSSDADMRGEPSPTDEMTLSVGFRMPTSATIRYDDGETYENYIDIAGGNYRIYFFDTENKLIGRFAPSGFLVSDGSNYRQYSVLGKAPNALARHGNFKMVVLANWQQYDDESLTPGTTTIDDICNAGWAQFDAKENFVLGPGNLMPFYGVHEYKNITFEPGVATILDEPTTLLRAMAKVEVILETDDNITLDSVKVSRYNAKGYCAPSGVYSQADYGQGLDWDSDYLRQLHLVGGGNDTGEKTLPFRNAGQWSKAAGGSTKLYEKWTAYLPEYSNAGEDYATIKLRFKGPAANEEDYSVFFAKYTDGAASNDAASRLNIERNNIYRFTVKRDPLLLLVTVEKWQFGGKVHIDM